MKLLVLVGRTNNSLPLWSDNPRDIANVSEGFCPLFKLHTDDERGHLTVVEDDWLGCSGGLYFKIVEDDWITNWYQLTRFNSVPNESD